MKMPGNIIGDFSASELEMPDEQVVDRVLQGDKEYYELLVRRYNERLYRIARSYLKDEQEIEDVMQEAYIKAFEKLGQFKGMARFSTWITRILINCALARLNQINKHRTLEIGEMLESSGEVGQYGDNLLEDAREYEVFQHNISAILESAIDQLPETYRAVFVMRLVQKMSGNETADVLGLTEDNVKVRLFRARKHLRDYLESSFSVSELFSFHLSKCDRITSAVLRCI